MHKPNINKLFQDEKLFSAAWFKDYSLILIGSLCVAAGYVYFITPFKIVPGGVYGLSIVIHYLTQNVFSFAPEGLPIGAMALVFNIPLAIAAHRYLGGGAAFKTVVTFVSTAVFVDLLFYFHGEKPLVANAPLLASIYGGIAIGVGVAFIFKAKGTSAGTDVISKIITKYFHLPIGYVIMMVDSCIVLIGLLAFRIWDVPLYSMITIFVYGKVVEIILQGISFDKAVFIISDKSEEIKDRIINDLKRGGTFLHGKGMYNGVEKEIIYTVVNNREISALQDYVRKIDSNAFMSVLETKEILGKGFKSFEEKAKE